MSNFFDKLTERCHEENSFLPDEWIVYETSIDPDDAPDGYIRVMGACFDKYTTGRKKGEYNFNSGMQKRTMRTFFLEFNKKG